MVESRLEIVNSFLEAVPSAEGFQQFDGSPHGVERRNFQDVRIVEVGDTFVLVFLKQRFQHCAGLLALFGEDIALAGILHALSSGERRLIERHVADEVEGVEVLSHFLGQRFE